MAKYDKYYNEKEKYFGDANKVLLDFFKSRKSKGTLVDLGAGQGRNSIPLAALGYDVTAVKISKVGLEQIKTVRSDIITLCEDIYSFDISAYDYIIMDSMLHFIKTM